MDIRPKRVWYKRWMVDDSNWNYWSKIGLKLFASILNLLIITLISFTILYALGIGGGEAAQATGIIILCSIIIFGCFLMAAIWFGKTNGALLSIGICTALFIIYFVILPILSPWYWRMKLLSNH